MRSVLILFLIIMLTSCPDNAQGTVSPPVSVDVSDIISAGDESKTVISSPIAVEGGNQRITVSGLESGRLYTIYSSSSSRKAEVRSDAESVQELTSGVYTISIPDGGNEISFSASEIGLGSGGSFRLGNVAVFVITFQDALDGIAIGKGTDEPLLIHENGAEYYEAFFSLDVSKIQDPENVVVNTYLSYDGVSSGSKAFRFIDEEGRVIESINGNAVIDLSDFDTVYLWMGFTVNYAENDMLFHLTLQNPVEVGAEITLRKHHTYSIAPSSEQQMLIVESEVGGWLYESLNARYAETGKHFMHVFPVALTDGHVAINIPPHSESILFDYGGNDGNARLVESDYGSAIDIMGTSTESFVVDEGTYIFPVIFADSLYGRTVVLHSDAPDVTGWLDLAHVSGNGYAVEMLSPGMAYQANNERKLEYFFLHNTTGKACAFTLSVK